MAYSIEQEEEYLGNDRWNWRAWIDASELELDAVDHVTWYLHPTYAEPVVELNNRQERFAIARSAWGSFQLQAEVRRKDGTTRKLRHDLQLWYPDNDGSAPVKGSDTSTKTAQRSEPRQNRIFLSYGIEDRSLAGAVRDTLEQGGYEVLDASQVVSGDPWQASIQKMLRESDLVLGLVTSEFASPNLVTELNSAHRTAKPTIMLMSPDVNTLFGLDSDMVRSEVNLADPKFGGSLLDLVERSLDMQMPTSRRSPQPKW